MGSSSHAFNSSETPGAQPRHPSDHQGNSVCVLPLTPELHTQDKSVQAISIANDTPKHVVPRPESQPPQPMVPQPMALDSSAPPPFLTKTYDMIDDRSTDAVVAWGANGNSFVVWNPPEFARDLLPKYFKHSNFSSFVRQLNTYGFRKVDPDRWEFANEGFLRGQKHLLKSIHRRKPSAHAPVTPSQPGQSSVAACVEVGKFGLEGEIERLKRDKNVLMMELVRLRQQQQQTDRDLHMMGQRLHVTEQRQQQMVSFLAKAMQNPSFLAQLVQQNEKNKRLATARKKRRLPKQDGDVKEHVVKASPEGQIIKYQPNSTDATRTMLSQFLNTPELGLKSDVPLDVLFRDLQSGAIEPRDSLGMPRITFTEVKGMPEQEVDQTNMLTSSGLESTLSGDSLENGYFMDSDGDKHGLKDDDSSMNLETDFTNGYDNQGSASIDDGTEINEMNDQSFWETLLNVSPGSQDTEADGDVDVDVDVGEIDLDVDATNNHWWSGAPNIEELAEQMEHLGSGPQVPSSKRDDASS